MEFQICLLQAEQLRELEQSSGFGEKIQPAEIKLAFEFEFRNDGIAMDNVKKIKQRKFQHLMDRMERPGRVKSGKQDDLEAGLTEEMKEGSRKITKGKVTSQNFQPSLMASVRRKRKKGFQLAKERGHLLHLLNETEPGGKFSTILQKWRQHNREPFYKSPLNLDLKEYTIQYKQQNLSLPNEFLSSNIFKQIDDMETSEEKDQLLPSSSSSSREGEVKEGLRRDRTPASQRAPILPLKHNLGQDKLVRGNSEIRSESDKTRHVEVLPSQLTSLQNLLLGKRNQVSEGQSALRTDAKTPTQSSRPRSRPSPRPPQPLPSALPTLASAKPPLPVSAEEIAAYLLRNCPKTTLPHIRRICNAFGVGQRKSWRGEALVEQLGSQIEDAIKVTKASPARKRKRLELDLLKQKQSEERRQSSLLSRMMEIIVAPFRGIFRLTRM